MARKPDRHKILTPEVLAAIMSEISPPRFTDEVLAFCEAAVAGLIERLERRDRDEAKAARQMYELMFDRFGTLVRDKRLQGFSRSQRLEYAKRVTQAFIAHRPFGLDPIELLIRSAELAQEVTQLRGKEARERWLLKHGVTRKRNVALWRPSALIEEVLAREFASNPGRVHKRLAEARKIISRYYRPTKTK